MFVFCCREELKEKTSKSTKTESPIADLIYVQRSVSIASDCRNKKSDFFQIWVLASEVVYDQTGVLQWTVEVF